jgi:olfactory receptor
MNLAARLLGVGPLIGILYSYCKIVSSTSAMSSAQGKYKAFSTFQVSLYFILFLGVYLNLAVTQNFHSSSMGLVMYSVVTAKLNPCIYTLRNKNIKGV